MLIKDKLQIILITYNRARLVKRTFEQFFFESSPVVDCDFVVIDNNSTDDTQKIVLEYATIHKNIKYIKNKYNVGIAGNIFKAMEFANKDYVWIIGDDDKFDFTYWNEVEQAIWQDEKLICISQYALPKEVKNRTANQLLQSTFITGCIYNTALFNDATMKNSMDMVYTLFPHFPPVLAFLNDGGKIYVTEHVIAHNGLDPDNNDYSYIRGYKNPEALSEKARCMTWLLGYAEVIKLLRDKSLRENCLDVAILHEHICQNWESFYHFMDINYVKTKKADCFLEIYNELSPFAQNKLQPLLVSLLASIGVKSLKGINKCIDAFYDLTTQRLTIILFGIKIKFKFKFIN